MKSIKLNRHIKVLIVCQAPFYLKLVPFPVITVTWRDGHIYKTKNAPSPSSALIRYNEGIEGGRDQL